MQISQVQLGSVQLFSLASRPPICRIIRPQCERFFWTAERWWSLENPQYSGHAPPPYFWRTPNTSPQGKKESCSRVVFEGLLTACLLLFWYAGPGLKTAERTKLHLQLPCFSVHGRCVEVVVVKLFANSSLTSNDK